MGRVSSREKYIERIFDLYRQEGLFLNMDVVAERIGVTKKTLYNNFESKEDMIRSTVQHMLNKVAYDLDKALRGGTDAIDSFRLALNVMKGLFDSFGEKLIMDVRTYLPEMRMLNHIDRMSLYSRLIIENYKRGVREGIFIKNLKIDYLAIFFTSSIYKMYYNNNVHVYLKDPYGFTIELAKYHLRSIVNDTGRMILSRIFKC